MMHRIPRLLFVSAALLSLTTAARATAGDPGALDPDDYKLYREYQAAMQDPRVEKIAPSQRLGAIARNFNVSRSHLADVIEEGDAHAAGLVEDNQSAAQTAVGKTPVGSRIQSLEMIDQGGTVIAYVRWQALDEKHLATDASWIAKSVAESAPLASVVAVWSCMGNAKVFTAKIRTSAAERIKSSRIDDFAETRYLRLFEDVRDVFKGQPPEDASGCE